MGVSVQELMRDHSELLGMRDLLLPDLLFQDAFLAQRLGHACLMATQRVHPPRVRRQAPSNTALYSAAPHAPRAPKHRGQPRRDHTAAA